MCEVDGRHDVAVVEWVLVTNHLEDVFGRCVERGHHSLSVQLGERDDILDLQLLNGARYFLVGWRRKLLDYSEKRRVVTDLILLKKPASFSF